jgi:7,8-dihydro-6-hydroxymethylpterin dimethyltransferase
MPDCRTNIITASEIEAARPSCTPPSDPLVAAKARMQTLGLWHPLQTVGRNFPIGCVALEVTQRCNLDCALCYLSDSSQAVHDLPLEEVFRRIDLIRAHYGPNTNVQVTGGDPTLRNRAELVAIVRRIAALEMRPSLFTNGIKATRDLLAELAAAGLVDVAFHVDTTQHRRGASDEASLAPTRLQYIERARGLGLSVLFNITVHPGNLHEVPTLARFFVEHAGGVRLVSFQIAADTGRGTASASTPVTIPKLAELLQQGAGAPINFDGLSAGHKSCNRYTLMLVAGGVVCDLLDDQVLYAQLLEAMAGRALDRRRPWRAVATVVGSALSHPHTLRRALPFVVRKAWALRRSLIASRGRVHKLSFFIHGFMGAQCLERDRIAACSFTVMTEQGPISMCLHNAKRDAFILRPTRSADGRWWDPVTGAWSDAPSPLRPVVHTRRTLKGRLKLKAETSR